MKKLGTGSVGLSSQRYLLKRTRELATPATRAATDPLSAWAVKKIRLDGRPFSFDGHEYLRFDLFNVSPHYHYEPPAEQERILMIDTVAEGDVVSWGVTRLRDRLVPMLVAAGGQGLADGLDEQVLARAVDDVESLVRNPPAPAPDAEP